MYGNKIVFLGALTGITVIACLTMMFALSTIRVITPEERLRHRWSQMQVVRKGDDEPSPVPWKIPEALVYTDPSRYINSGFLTSNLTFSPGLGNLMFQYASLVALALETNRTLVLNSKTYLRRAFKIQRAELAAPDIADNLLRTWPRHKFPVCCKHNQNVTKILTGSAENVAILGYFQSFRYFDAVGHLIKDELQFLPEIKSRAEKLLLSAISSHSSSGEALTLVGLHVRHGVELTWNTRNKYHGHTVANSLYYQRAMKHFRSLYDSVLFIMTTDDVFYTRQWLQCNDTVLVTSEVREVDMCILTLCNHTIMSTGTFGWWSAYLAGGDVVYYNNWPLPKSKLESMVEKDDFFPSHWLAM